MSVASAVATKIGPTLEKKFSSAAGVGNVALVEKYLSDPAIRAAIPTAFGDHAVINVTGHVKVLQRSIDEGMKFPNNASIQMDVANDRAYLGRLKTIVGDLKAAGARLTADLVKFLGG
ncbi:MAG: hypothetical protein JWM80_826 [Cyanobacteria bacterium RYN_339]|nr:hypothetical protein [Cyanobacteria bacterium RYN_339]